MKDEKLRRVLAIGVVATLAALVQLLLLKNFMEREVAWDFVLHGDPTWYVYFCYKIFEDLLRGDFADIGAFAQTSPWGVVLYLESAVTQLFFGSSRFGIVVVNLIYYLIAQYATFAFFRRIGGSIWSGGIAVLLFMAMRTPFRGDGPGLNIADFHFDLAFYLLLIVVFYLVAWSDTFARRNLSIVIALISALLVATRIVSAFLLIGIFGTLFLFLLWRLWKATAQERTQARDRVVNLLIASGIFLVLSAIPIAVAGDAVYSHYFQFVFNPEFRAERRGLYTMGESSKLGQAAKMIHIILDFDFGPLFLAALIGVGIVVVLGRGAAAGRTSSEPASESGLAHSKTDYVSFLIIATFVSFFMHLAFPIKSDHLTRLTAAPIFVLIAYFSAIPVANAFRNTSQIGHRAAVLACCWLGLVTAAVQLSFYAGHGRHAARKAELLKINHLYSMMSHIVHMRGQTHVANSVDKFVSFELGAMESFFTYEYERNGRLLIPDPQMGGIIDQPLDFKDAISQVRNSDFVLLLNGPYPEHPHWPLMKSIQTYRPELVAFVRKNFCLLSRTKIEGLENDLYVRPFLWHATASASIAPQFGPEDLLSATPGTIWHAPWKPDATQWVEFDASTPVTVTELILEAQDGAPERAPRQFTLDAINADGSARRLLTVDNAEFHSSQWQSWPIGENPAARRFRLTVTQNNGDPTLMTIQQMSLSTQGMPCEFGEPFEQDQSATAQGAAGPAAEPGNAAAQPGGP